VILATAVVAPPRAYTRVSLNNRLTPARSAINRDVQERLHRRRAACILLLFQHLDRYHGAAVERPPSERAASLVAATAADETWCREVESLLDSSEMSTDRLPFRNRSSQASSTRISHAF
jgi:hypothetical protein